MEMEEKVRAGGAPPPRKLISNCEISHGNYARISSSQPGGGVINFIMRLDGEGERERLGDSHGRFPSGGSTRFIPIFLNRSHCRIIFVFMSMLKSEY